MPRATTIVRRAAVRADRVADTVSLDHAARAAASGRLITAGGLAFDVALAKAASLEDGDALRLDDGRLVAVRAAEEALLEVRAENPARLMRLAWHLGGGHIPAEIAADVLYVPAGPAAAELARGGGCTASPVHRAFRPEKAAHDHGACGHEHHHHDHAHHDHGHHDHGHHEHGHDDHAHHGDHPAGGHGHEHGHQHRGEHDHGHRDHGRADGAHGPGHAHDHR